MKIQLLEPEDFPGSAVLRLRRLGPVIEGETAQTGDVEAVFTRLASRLGPEFHGRYPRLRWVVSPTTGLNHIDLAHFEAHGVEILSLRGRTDFLDTIRATAEHTLGLALALLRRLPSAVEAVRHGRWDRYPHKGRELSGKDVLVFGYGRIGRQVAELYRAFGCTVHAHDIVPGRVPDGLAGPLDDLLARADILSLHVPLRAETEGMIGAELLHRLKPGALLINTSRGELIDQEALLAALESKRLAGAALDVLTGEPAPLSEPLLRRIAALGDRLVITPHIGGFTFESLEAVESHLVDIFIEAAGGAA